jgi:hypothetical protein
MLYVFLKRRGEKYDWKENLKVVTLRNERNKFMLSQHDIIQTQVNLN